MKYVYTGPSWAGSSFPTDGSATNLSKEWNIPCQDLSKFGSTVLDRVEAVKFSSPLPIIWIYNEPIKNLSEITGLSYKQFIQRSDWQEVWEDCNQFCLKAIASLNRPVLLIGAHSDVVNCNHLNITVGHASWQKFLAQQAKMPLINDQIYVKMSDGGNFMIQHCWGADWIQKYMHEHQDVTPYVGLTNAVWDIFFFWEELEKANLFYHVHPNLQGNKLFAEHLKLQVDDFLKNHK